MPKPFRETTFGAQLRLLRRRAQLTQSELSLAVGYSEAQISRLETGRRPPDLPALIALFCPALGVDPHTAEGEYLLALAAAARPAAPHPNPPPLSKAAHPTPTFQLIGRAHERALITELFTQQHARLVTLLGTAGAGKTRLALHMAHELAPHFTHGATIIELAAVTDITAVPAAIAGALELSEAGYASATAAVLAHLQTQHCLLVLDNVEQLPSMGRLVGEWLAAVPGLHLLLTSRIALRLTAEHIVPLGPLAVPPLAPLPPLEQLAGVEAMALLLARLRVATPGLQLTAANALPLAAICVQVDGLPLALELVAAHGRLFTPTELLTEMAHRFLQMNQRGTDVHYRHHSASAALSWSYDQLPPATQALFTRLAIFANGWWVEAAVAVCDMAQAGATAVQEALQTLLDHSLLQRQTVGEETRLTMLGMVREFARHQLAERGEEDVLHSRHLAYLIDWAESAAPFLLRGSQQGAWLARLEAEHDNFRHALRWAQTNAPAQGVRLAAALWRFWYMRGYLREGRQWASLFLSHAAEVEPPIHAKLLDGAAILAWRQADYATAEAWATAALTLYQQVSHTVGVAQVLGHLGLIASDQGRAEQARAHYAASLPFYQAQSDWAGAASVLHNMGNLACQQNDNTAAQAYYQQCADLYTELGDDSGLALVSLGLGVIAREAGQPTEAHTLFERSRTLAQKVGDGWNMATADINLGELATDAGDWSAARLLLGRALAHFEQMGDQQSICVVQGRLADVALRAGEPDTAVRLFRQELMLAHGVGFQLGVVDALEGLAACMALPQPTAAVQLLATAAALRHETGWPLAPAEQLRHEALLDSIRPQLTPLAWAQAWEKGGKMGLGAAVALALTA